MIKIILSDSSSLPDITKIANKIAGLNPMIFKREQKSDIYAIGMVYSLLLEREGLYFHVKNQDIYASNNFEALLDIIRDSFNKSSYIFTEATMINKGLADEYPIAKITRNSLHVQSKQDFSYQRKMLIGMTTRLSNFLLTGTTGRKEEIVIIVGKEKYKQELVSIANAIAFDEISNGKAEEKELAFQELANSGKYDAKTIEILKELI